MLLESGSAASLEIRASLEGKQQREKKRREDWQRHEGSMTECSSKDPRGSSGVQAGSSMEVDWCHARIDFCVREASRVL